jgi:tetratricopeptide (TPR) repeat protein
MHRLNQALQAGYAAFQRGDYAVARQALSAFDHPKAVHLLALVEKADKRFDTAARLFDKAAGGDPNDPEIANNQGVLALQMGRDSDAEGAFKRALAINPEFQQAATGLGRLYLNARRWDEAAEVYNALLAAAPQDPVVRYGYATTLLERGEAEAAEANFDSLVAANPNEAAYLFMRARARLELSRTEEAIQDLEQSFAKGPSELCLRVYAGALWMTGATAQFEALLNAAASNPALVVTAADILRQGGQPQRAVEVIEMMQRQNALPADSWTVAATALIDLDRPADAESAARQCLQAEPENRLVRGSLITSLLMQGKAADALELSQEMRAREPDDQHWIACEATALRLLGDERYGRLVDLERFVRPYTLPVPEGFADLETFNQQFLKALEPWHNYRTHPLEQSLRDGSQTPRDLTSIRDPVIEAFIKALDVPIRQYMKEVGSGSEHPLTARNSGDYRIAGCWSVRLQGGGRHVNHVHPEGWISSSYYVSVPPETRSGDDKAGWIKFSEPPFATIPESPPEKWVQPEAGLLVLFPSFLWHGTAPIHDGSVRVTAPFDAVPA